MKPSTADAFSTADLAQNWQTLDDHPGYRVCTSSTRPAWGASQEGMIISEQDTGLTWRWDGGAFQRMSGTGLLKCTDGSWAQATRTTNISTTDRNVGVVVVQVNGVVIPDGFRTIMITATTGEAVNTTHRFVGKIMRSNIAGQGPQLMSGWLDGTGGSTPGESGVYSTWTTYERGGLAPGTYNYSFQMLCDPNSAYTNVGTSTLWASGGAIVLSVIEL